MKAINSVTIHVPVNDKPAKDLRISYLVIEGIYSRDWYLTLGQNALGLYLAGQV